MNYILAMVVSLLIALITMPFLMKLANKLQFTDKPNKRKQHKMPTPLCGGIALYIGFFISYFIFIRDDIKATDNCVCSSNNDSSNWTNR